MQIVDVAPVEGLCLRCGLAFPYRSNKKYCSPKCRVSANRPTQNSGYSRSKRRHNLEKFERALVMGNDFYDLPPFERLGYMKELIDRARSGVDPQLVDILTNPKLLKPQAEGDRRWYPRRCRAYLTIAQAAEVYCVKFWNAHVWEVVRGKVSEPPTGEVDSSQ